MRYATEIPAYIKKEKKSIFMNSRGLNYYQYNYDSHVALRQQNGVTN